MLLVLLLVLSYPAQRRPKRFLMTRQTHCDCWSPRPLRVIFWLILLAKNVQPNRILQ
ncbi:hypothetical protein I3843_11G093400 [Carya illinoinensis]|nr:hypothetical protein I3843_11G093400 [Carya illinoinensis]